MSDSTLSPRRPTAVFAAVLTLVVAAAAFALSFYALAHLAHLAGIFPERFTWLLPVVVDVFMLQATVCLVDATTRGDRSARTYHWAMLATFSSISVVGNAYHAFVVGRGGVLPAAVAAGIAIVAPLALLASTHGLVMHLWRTESHETAVPKVQPEPAGDGEREGAIDVGNSAGVPDQSLVHGVPSVHDVEGVHVHGAPGEIDAGAEVEEEYLVLAHQIYEGGRRTNREVSAEQIACALQAVDRGATHEEAAQRVGVNRSTVSRWAEKARTHRPQQILSDAYV